MLTDTVYYIAIIILCVTCMLYEVGSTCHQGNILTRYSHQSFGQ